MAKTNSPVSNSPPARRHKCSGRWLFNIAGPVLSSSSFITGEKTRNATAVPGEQFRIEKAVIDLIHVQEMEGVDPSGIAVVRVGA
jgi:hypothetical protein